MREDRPYTGWGTHAGSRLPLESRAYNKDSHEGTWYRKVISRKWNGRPRRVTEGTENSWIGLASWVGSWSPTCPHSWGTHWIHFPMVHQGLEEEVPIHMLSSPFVKSRFTLWGVDTINIPKFQNIISKSGYSEKPSNRKPEVPMRVSQASVSSHLQTAGHSSNGWNKKGGTGSG